MHIPFATREPEIVPLPHLGLLAGKSSTKRSRNIKEILVNWIPAYQGNDGIVEFEFDFQLGVKIPDSCVKGPRRSLARIAQT